MKRSIWTGGIGGILLLLYVLWQKRELRRFGITRYEIPSGKLKERHGAAVLADLHGFSYGRKNRRLLAALEQLQPELILIAGDMIVSKEPKTYDRALETLEELVKIAPVYYGFGNHETRASHLGQYCRQAEALGVRFLRNSSQKISLGEDSLILSGLELDLSYYKKGQVRSLDAGDLSELLGTAEDSGFQILLAHNPAYSEAYAAWGADVTFCGHNHGGLVRIPGIGGILSAQLTFFPKYGEGCHKFGDKRVIISRGLGTHTFHIRIFNRAELVFVSLYPKSS